MTNQEKLAKAEKDYYASIEITHEEYRESVKIAKSHHQHVYKPRFSLGVAFYECVCGDKHAGVYNDE